MSKAAHASLECALSRRLALFGRYVYYQYDSMAWWPWTRPCPEHLTGKG